MDYPVGTPKTITDLFNQVTAAGGEVLPERDRLWTVSLPRRFRDSEGNRSVRQVNVCQVGYYVRDGRAKISGTRKVREALTR